MNWPLYLLVALTSSWLLTDLLIPWVTRFAQRFGRMDQPDGRKVHTTPIPRLGGIAIAAGFFGSVLLLQLLVPGGLFQWDGPMRGVLVGAGLMFAIGLLDDLCCLSAKVKFAMQIGASLLAFWLGVRIEFLSHPEGGIFILPSWLAVVVSLFWMVGITNTINLIDGLDGLAAGVSMIAAITIGLIAMQTNQPVSAILALGLVGGTIGFLRYNFNPAKIFMGDSGSLFLGFTLAAVSVIGVLKLIATMTFVLPLLILGVPIFDTAFAIVRRAIQRRPIFSPDKGHLHHRLLNAGLSQRRAVVMIYGLCLLLGGTALSLVGMVGAGTMILTAALFLAWGAWSLRHAIRTLRLPWRKEMP